MFRHKRKILVGIGALITSAAFADVIDGEELIDPTRPFSINIRVQQDTGIVDPFRTVVPDSYDVSFIRASGTSPIAIVNNQRVTLGDMIGDAEVFAIDRNGVTLLIDDEEQRFTLYGPNVKSAVTNQQ